MGAMILILSPMKERFWIPSRRFSVASPMGAKADVSLLQKKGRWENAPSLHGVKVSFRTQTQIQSQSAAVGLSG